ncbi:hypothetical protein LXA43DRAFT_1147957 [Ganoderma leucocontextum]|nr:hypothetical protein LXA43DRAFT_1147957 [Ganoderma leucocontextum]
MALIEALPACLTCKRAYRLAIARVASLASCQSFTHLRWLCEYYLSSDPFTGVTRAKYLEDLIIHATTFQRELNGAEPSQSPAQLIGELLVHAQNIRRLALDRFHPLVKTEAKISLAFSSMHRLAQIRFSKVADGSLNVLQRIGNPKRLTLAYLVYENDLRDGCRSLPPLLATLASFPNLHTVMLWKFKPWDPEDSAPLPPLPSVRYLLLSQASVQALDMVERCPNLSTLVFSVDVDIADDTTNAGLSWRPLRRVMLASRREGVYVRDHLSTVSLLQVSGKLGLSWEPEVSGFLDLLRIASPIGLYFGFYVTRLDWWSGEDNDQMTRQLLDMLSNIPLSVLKILVPPTPSPSRKNSADYYRRELAKAKVKEKERMVAMAALPRLLVDAIPSLCYLSVADMAPNTALTDDTPDGSDTGDSSDDYDDSESGVRPDGWDDLREIGRIGKQMWWKIVEEEGQRVMVEISEDEGERAKREVELQDDEEMLRIEGECVPSPPLRAGC